MKEILFILDVLRSLSGNAQIEYLQEHKSDLLKEILEYTYNPHKKYKIEEGKFNKFDTGLQTTEYLTENNWNGFKQYLDKLCELKSAKDEDVKQLIYFLEDFNYESQQFLKMVLFKDLRISMNIKKFQKVWSDFCVSHQVQLAQKWEGQKFENGYYSRKLDGLRTYILNGLPYSRSNKQHNIAPFIHILHQLKMTFFTLNDYVLDGEIIYMKDGKEDFQKAVSLVRSEQRTEECDDLYFVVFDIIPKDEFINKDVNKPFCEEYEKIQALLGITKDDISWYNTNCYNVLCIKQVKENQLEQMQNYVRQYGWEGLMYRDGNAPYECKRTKSLLKIKKMQDIELKLVDMEEGTGKHKGKLGAFVVEYEDSHVKIGSGFSDEQREEYWNNKDKYIGEYVKTQYFEKTMCADGTPSLRFPVFLAFRNMKTGDEFLKKF